MLQRLLTSAIFYVVIQTRSSLAAANSPTRMPSADLTDYPSQEPSTTSNDDNDNNYYYGSTDDTSKIFRLATDDDFELPNRGNDCKAKKIKTSYDCDIYHRGNLLANGTRTTIGPSIDVIPTRNSSAPKEVKVAIKFNDLNSADSILGSVNVGVEISLWWRNDFANWDIVSCSKYNKSSTDVCPPYDVYELSFDSKAMWTPDFQLANDAVPWDQGFPKSIKAIIDYSGGTNMILTGQMTFSCNFVMTDFPFDSQSCDATFSSRAYFDDALTFVYDENVNSNFTTAADDSSAIVKKDPGYILMDSFTHPAWKVLGISAEKGYRKSIRKAKSGADRFSTLSYTIKLKRFSSYYLYVAVGPTILITIVAYLSLFIFDSDTKLATTSTCLLTIMAIQWIVSTLIPITHDNPWIMRFCTACIAYVGCICVCVLFLSYVDEVEDLYKRQYVLNTAEDLQLHIDINPRSYSQANKSTNDEESKLDEAQKSVNKVGCFKKLLTVFHPYSNNDEQLDEPMPIWLRMWIDLYRPVAIMKSMLASKQVSGDGKKVLLYSYKDAQLAVVWTFRIGGAIALSVVLGIYFTSIDSSA